MICKHCGNECVGESCHVCGALTPEGKKAAKTENKRRHILFKWWFWLIVVVFLATVAFSVFEQTRRINNGESIYGVVNNTRRMNSGSWTSYDQAYVFSVDESNFLGDIYESGVYAFTLNGGVDRDEYMSAFYDVYVCDEVYDSVEHMQEHNKPAISVGGLGSGNVKTIHELNKGEYVYIVPYVQEGSKPTGYLSFEKLKGE